MGYIIKALYFFLSLRILFSSPIFIGGKNIVMEVVSNLSVWLAKCLYSLIYSY